MPDITLWAESFLRILEETFRDRVFFAGLQGSYARGEATEKSDIDMVVILDELSFADLQVYNAMLERLPHRELLCGFLSGKKELMSWDPAELFQFYHDTKPLKGSLDELLFLIDQSAIHRAIKTGTCGIYHGCVHNMLYDKSEDILRGLYKSASFILQALCFTKTGRYISRQSELLPFLSPDDRAIAETFLNLKGGGAVDLEAMSETLFNWSAGLIAEAK